jgi:hypothetical protein
MGSLPSLLNDLTNDLAKPRERSKKLLLAHTMGLDEIDLLPPIG